MLCKRERGRPKSMYSPRCRFPQPLRTWNRKGENSGTDALRVFHNLRERESTSILWEFPTNLITLLLDLKSHMPVTHTATCETYNLHSNRLTRRGFKLGMNSTSDMFILLKLSNVCQQNHYKPNTCISLFKIFLPHV